MEIGGCDICFEMDGASARRIAETVVHQIFGTWLHAIAEDGNASTTPEVFSTYETIPWNRLKYLLIYEDRAAYVDLFEKGVTEANGHQLIHVAWDETGLTLVVNSREDPFALHLVSLIEYVMPRSLH